MPLQKLEFRPGLNREGTDYANEGGWYDGDKIRFRSGFPEKIGGWTQYSSAQYIGIARSLWSWNSITGANYLGVGTADKYYISNSVGGSYYDVTPIYFTSPGVSGTPLTNPFATVAGSPVIKVTDVNYLNANIGDYIIISAATSTDATITETILRQEYVITNILGGTVYEIVAYSTKVNAGSFVVGQKYSIQYPGNTDFTLIGAANNSIGTIFTATGTGVGSGVAGKTVNATSTGSIGGASPTIIQYEYPAGLNSVTTSDGWGAGPWSPTVTVAMGTNPFATAFSTLNGTITSGATSLVVASGTSFPSAGIIKIDNEYIAYTSKATNTLSGLTRGYYGTTAAAHTSGANVGSSTISVTQTAHGYLVNATDLVEGTQYKIVTPGTTNFVTLFGASANTAGTIFTATASGTVASGTGTASKLWVAFPDTRITGYISGTTLTLLGAAGQDAVKQGTVAVGQTVYGSGLPAAGIAISAAVGTAGTVWTLASSGGTIGSATTPQPFTLACSAVSGIPGSSFMSTFELTYVSANVYTINLNGDNTRPPRVSTTTAASGGGSGIVNYPQYGTRAWSTPYISSTTTATVNELRLWSNDNYGQDLVIAPRGGPIYYWVQNNGVTTRAVSLKSLASTAVVDPAYAYTYQDYVPVAVSQVLSAPIQQFIIALGSNSFVNGSPNTSFNPMIVRWSDQAGPTNWVPDVTNQSGEFVLTNGSQIVTGRTTRQEVLIWTDSCLYSMQYLGAPYVWGFNVLMDNISIMSPNASVTVNNVTYWMGVDKFYMYSGRVETLPCSLRQYIFDDINLDENYQVFAGSNEGYNEVWWYYVSSNSADNTVDKYVIYNYLDRVWYYGTMARTAWLDTGLLASPIAADYNNRILYHESGVNDAATSTPLPINAFVQSSDFDIGDGHNFGFVWRILPDINFNGSTVNNPTVTMTIKPRVNSGTPYGAANNPSVTSDDLYASSRVYNIQEFTGQVYTRLRGRQLAFRIESNSTGVSWQLGCPRIDIRPDGRR